MKKYLKILFSFIALLIFTNNVYATTIKETTATNDEYDTIERNTTIIGVTKFTANEVITASKATTAGANDATLYMKKHGTTEGYTSPTIYIYYGPVGGWYSLDENNNATYINDKNLLEKLSKLEIYYVNNKEKVIGVEYTGDEIDTRKLPKGVSYSDNQLLVNSTLSFFDIYTKRNDKISYSFNDTLNTFEIDNSSCYTIKDGYITDYDINCSKEVVIPSEIKNEKIVGIDRYAFYNIGITDVVIPESIIYIKDNAFIYNDLESVTINEKYDETDFEIYGENVFGDFTDITYNNNLTRTAKLIPNNIELNISKEVVCKEKPMNDYISLECQYGENDYNYYLAYALIKLENELKSHGYDSVTVDAEIDEDETNGNKTYKIVLYDENNFDKEGNYRQYEQEIDYKLIEFTPSKEDIDTTTKIINDIENTEDNYFTEKININQLEDIEEKYEFEINYYNYFYYNDEYDYYYVNDVNDKNLNITLYSSYFSIITIEKNNQIYGAYIGKNVIDGSTFNIMNNNITYNSYEYRTTLLYKDYSNIEEYINDVLKEFEKEVGITNYKIIPSNNQIYQEITNEYTERVKYIVKIIDLNSNLPWTIIMDDYYEDYYDKDGYTDLSCFNIYEGSIGEYDDTCGENVVIPLYTEDGTKITTISDYAFNGKNIKSVKLNENITEIGYQAFSYTLLEEITIPNSVEVISFAAFSWCYKLSKVNLPNSLRIIDACAFDNTNIKEIILPNTLEEIGTLAFENTKLENIILPNSLKKFGQMVFYNVKNLKEVTIPKSLEDYGPDVFDENVKINFEDKFFELSQKIPNKIEINIHENIYGKMVDKSGELTEEGNLYRKTILFNKLDSILGNDYQICEYDEECVCESNYCVEDRNNFVTIYNKENKQFTVRMEYNYNKITGKEDELQKSKEIINNKIKDTYVEKYIKREETITSDFIIEDILQKDGFSLVKVYDDTLGGICPLRGDIEEVSFCGGKDMNFYLIKDEILYAITDEYLKVVTPLYYVSNLNPDNYNTVNEYKQSVLKSFSDYTKVTNYEIETLEEEVKEKLLIPENQDIMYVKDDDTNRYWYILYTTMTLSQKEVPIKVIPTGEVQTGKAIADITSDIIKVTIYGSKKALEVIEYLPVEINVAGLNTDKEFDVTLVSPENIEKISTNKAKINVTLGEETTKEIENLMIEVLNLDTNYKAAATEPNSVKVNAIIKGTQEVLDTIDESQIKAVVDLSGYTEGEYEVEIKIIGEDLKAIYTPVTKKITVRISER